MFDFIKLQKPSTYSEIKSLGGLKVEAKTLKAFTDGWMFPMDELEL